LDTWLVLILLRVVLVTLDEVELVKIKIPSTRPPPRPLFEGDSMFFLSFVELFDSDERRLFYPYFSPNEIVVYDINISMQVVAWQGSKLPDKSLLPLGNPLSMRLAIVKNDSLPRVRFIPIHRKVVYQTLVVLARAQQYLCAVHNRGPQRKKLTEILAIKLSLAINLGIATRA